MFLITYDSKIMSKGRSINNHLISNYNSMHVGFIFNLTLFIILCKAKESTKMVAVTRYRVEVTKIAARKQLACSVTLVSHASRPERDLEYERTSVPGTLDIYHTTIYEHGQLYNLYISSSIVRLLL